MIVRTEQRNLQGWTEDAVKAMQENPDYFVWWDRWKTRALVVTLGLLAWKIAR